MTDFYVAFTLLGVTFAGAIVYAFFKWLHDRSQPKTPSTSYSAPDDYRYNPATSIVETNSGFITGAVIGSALNSHRAAHKPAPVLYTPDRRPADPGFVVPEDYAVIPLIIAIDAAATVATQQPDTEPAAFTGFSGGDSNGGGATGSWDTPADNCPVGSPSGDNSSCDTSNSSYDSGSASSDYGSFDSGGSGSSDF